MIQLKINGQWKNADMLGLWVNREGKGNYHEVEIQDFKAFGADYSYIELMKLSNVDRAYKVEQVYSESGLIGDLSKRVSDLEEIIADLRGDIQHYDAVIDALSKRLDSEEIKCLQERVEKLEQKPQSTVQEAPISELEKRITKLEDGLTTHVIGSYEHLKDSYVNRISEHQTMIPDNAIYVKPQIDWEQRRYEIAKELYARHVYDIGNTAIQATEAANKLINELKKQENDN
jgi:chromosome segregation ATPase